MNIYRDTISEFLGMTPLSQDQLAEISAEAQLIRNEATSQGWGGATWSKETFPEHPFVGGKLQRDKVENGSHHLQNSVSCVGPKGDIIRMPIDEYESQSEYVSISSDEAFIRRGLDPKKDRVTNLGKKMPLDQNAPQKLKGDDRTEAQKKAAKEHSNKMKGRKLWPDGRTFSEEHINKLRKPRKSMSFKEYKCPHCGKEGRGNSMVRWHMDNCKMKKG